MAGPQRRKKTHKGGHALRRLEKTKRLRKGLDQITDEVKKPEKLAFKKTLDEDLPGMGRFYCFACRYDNQLFYFCFFIFVLITANIVSVLKRLPVTNLVSLIKEG